MPCKDCYDIQKKRLQKKKPKDIVNYLSEVLDPKDKWSDRCLICEKKIHVVYKPKLEFTTGEGGEKYWTWSYRKFKGIDCVLIKEDELWDKTACKTCFKRFDKNIKKIIRIYFSLGELEFTKEYVNRYEKAYKELIKDGFPEEEIKKRNLLIEERVRD